MSLLQRIRDKFFSNDRRRSDRMEAPELAAYFWTGGTPLEHRIRDISATGLYLITEDTWFPGTMCMITLQNKDAAEDDPHRAVVIQTRVVRRNEDGVGLLFLFSDSNEVRRGQNPLRGGTDRKTVEKFLKGFLSDSGRVIVHNVLPPN